jgi:predicted lipoprotein with Yx(FWY)xxD motif
VRNRATLAASILFSAGLMAAAVSAPALASTQHRTTHPKGTTISTRVTPKFGRILANTKGRVMYLHTTDQRTVSTCTGVCASAWPKVTSKAKPLAAKGVSAKHLARNKKGQVTYYGHPLYYFVGSGASGEGEASFFVVSTTGKAVHPKKATKPGTGATGAAEVTTGMAGGTTVITTKAGRTLYALGVFAENTGTFWCTAACVHTWIPLLTKGTPTAAGDAMQSDLKFVKRAGIGDQVTYNGYPVYRYKGDTAAGQDNGEGLAGPYANGQVWNDVTPAGALNPAP